MVIQGKAYYAKVLGPPAWGYKNQYKEWSVDVTIDEATKKRLMEAGMHKSALKNKGDARGDFITFKRREIKKDGTPGKAIEVVDKKGAPWNPRALIGNESVVNAKIILNENQDGEMKPGLLKMQVVEHVEYEGRGDEEDLPVYNDDGTVEDWSQ